MTRVPVMKKQRARCVVTDLESVRRCSARASKRRHGSSRSSQSATAEMPRVAAPGGARQDARTTEFSLERCSVVHDERADSLSPWLVAAPAFGREGGEVREKIRQRGGEMEMAVRWRWR